MSGPAVRRPGDPWVVAMLLAGAAVVALHLAALAISPPGLYQDEASIGYDAWAIAHHGHDQHGAALPLFLESFGDWKSPLYVYLLAPLTWVLPLTPATIRLPAALCGLAVCALWTATAWRLTRSRPVTLVALLTAGTVPWLGIESRLGFEVITLVLCLSAALWALVHAELGDGRRWYAGCGVALGLCVVAYPTGRVAAALVAGAVAAGHLGRGRRRRSAGWWLALAGPAAAYAVVGAWMLAHPGALTARFSALSITHDGAGAPTVAARFLVNYLRHWGPDFLLVRGDGNPRQSTQVGGLVLLATAPAIAAGVLRWLRSWERPLSRTALIGLAASPVGAALTDEGIPHALRASPMLPFLLLAAVEGWAVLLPWLRRHRRAAAALAAAAAIQAGAWTADLFLTYPGRVQDVFEAAYLDAARDAHRAAGGHAVLISRSLSELHAQALVELRPAPGGSLDETLARIGVRPADAAAIPAAARPGDIVVVRRGDPLPARAELVRVEHPDGGGASAAAAEVLLYRAG